MKLYGYFRSSAAYRARIALNLKGLAYESISVHLVKDGGAQFRPDYVKRNPQALVPTLETDDLVLTQSLAIIDYLDDICPDPPLLPDSPAARARVRAIALAIACDIHPLNNLRVLNFLTNELAVSSDDRTRWYHHWVESGLAAVEKMLAHDPGTGTFCHGDQPGLADICLVPQVANAERFACDLGPCPTIRRINDACLAMPAFSDAAPQNQSDAE